MRPQKKPFTVSVKRKRRSGAPNTLWSDTPELSEFLRRQGVEADAEATAEEENVETPRHERAETGGDAKTAAARQPRVLASREPAWAPPRPNPDAEPEATAKRPAHRKPKTSRSAATPQASERPVPPVSRTSVSQACDPEPAVSAAAPVTARAPVAGAPSGEPDRPLPAVSAATIEASPSAADDGAAAPRVRSRRRQASGLRRGERWKRHLPRWSR